MSTIRIPNGFLTLSPDFKPGDPEPTGYLEWHAWAEVQHKSGIKPKLRAQVLKFTPQEPPL